MQFPRRTADRILIALALAGAAAYFLFFGRLFPDGAVRLDVPQQEIRLQAWDFAHASGFSLEDVGSTELRRQTRLYDSLQTNLGRRELVRRMRLGDPEVPPVHFWQNEFDATGRNDRRTAQGTVTVHVTPQGEVWSISASEDAARPRANRSRLRAALGNLEALPGGLDALPDSMLLQRLYFDSAVDDTAGMARAAAEGGPVPVPVHLADEVARAYLADTYWRDVPLALDSILVAANRARNIATVRYHSAENQLGSNFEVRVQLTAAGALQSIEPRLRGARGETTPTVVETVNYGGGAGMFSYFLLSIIIVVSFFRRMTAHAIDYRAAVRDGALVTILLALFFGLAVFVQVISEAAAEGVGVVLGLGATLLALSAVAGVYTFVLSAVGDSAAREVWPEKLRALTLARQAHYLNKTVGQSVLRGIGAAFVLLGAVILFSRVFGDAGVRVRPAVIEGFSALTHVLANISLPVFLSLIACNLVLLGIGSLLYKRIGSVLLFAVTGVLLFTAVSASFVQFTPGVYGWLLSGVLGVVLVWLFWEYDFVVPFLALALAPLIWSVSMGWSVAGSPVGGAALAVLFLVLVMVGVGFVGVKTGQDESELPTYVPRYIQELARHEHVERELDIARRVQTTFLPRKMPRLRTASVSAICIPAYEVGGDYYDFMALDENRMAIVIGDVSGKGIQAAFYMTLIKGFVQTLCCETHTPLATMKRINYLFCRNAPRGTFVSLIFGIFDQREGTFRFARAGHSPVIYKRRGSATPELISPSGMAVGLTSDGRFEASIREETIVLEAGDSLVLYTDGISEAVDRRNVQFGEERLLKAISSSSARRAEQLIDAVSLAVQNFARGVRQHDDMTMVVLKVNDDYIRQPVTPPQQEQAAEYVRCAPEGDGSSTATGSCRGG